MRFAARSLQDVGTESMPAVLFIDGIDESPLRSRLSLAIAELSRELPTWKIVVSARTGVGRIRQLSQTRRFHVLYLDPLSEGEARTMLARVAPNAPQATLDSAVERADGQPLALVLLGDMLRQHGELPEIGDERDLRPIEQAYVSFLEQASAPLVALLDQLAVAGKPEAPSTLAARTELSEDVVRRHLTDNVVVGHDSTSDTYVLDELFRSLTLSRRILQPTFTLAELSFGDEAAERDDRLTASYVPRPELERIQRDRTIVIGDRGAGKSAIFQRLSDEGRWGEGVDVVARFNMTSLLERIVTPDAVPTVHKYRAIWLVAFSVLVSSRIGTDAPRALRRTARRLDSAFGQDGTKRMSAIKRWSRAGARRLGGSSLKLAVGPVKLEATLPPSGEQPSRKRIDIDRFLADCDEHLGETGRSMVIMFDRVDELHTYDRARQEPLVQALLQAEDDISQLRNLQAIVFLRTDLFELYDIQEKNKRVSRSLTLEWPEEDWLRLLITRVLTNAPLERLAQVLTDVDGSLDPVGAVEALFPAEIEGQPIERWLIESVRNGNGKLSARLAILLLHLTCELSTTQRSDVVTLPIFSDLALQSAMTKLSNLSYDEVVNDFKIAGAFVLNCRAAKLREFVLKDVTNLFDDADGPTNEQLLMLERLGFLERVVLRDPPNSPPIYRIPKLYTRCWDYA